MIFLARLIPLAAAAFCVALLVYHFIGTVQSFAVRVSTGG